MAAALQGFTYPKLAGSKVVRCCAHQHVDPTCLQTQTDALDQGPCSLFAGFRGARQLSPQLEPRQAFLSDTDLLHVIDKDPWTRKMEGKPVQTETSRLESEPSNGQSDPQSVKDCG